MVFRMSKRIKIAPGIKLNLSKSGISTTVGGRGASVNIGKKGAYLNAGIPGTGISSRHKLSNAKTNKVEVERKKPRGSGIGVAFAIFVIIGLIALII